VAYDLPKITNNAKRELLIEWLIYYGYLQENLVHATSDASKFLKKRDI
jgi:hypothetical protein